jgi:tetratricopeptide (TPR) repeat protein
MWRSRPVFISSTFADMQAERDYLRSDVFPELEERLRARRHHLVWVDLRLGIPIADERDEQVRDRQVLKVCLDQVMRCRPFMIVLLGDRYGWVPKADRIRAAAGDAGAAFAAPIEGRSVTDLEIDLGVLANADQQARTWFYFREPLPYAAMDPAVARLYAEARAGEAGQQGARRLADLKRRITDAMPDRVRRYVATWRGGRVGGLEAFGARVLDDLWDELERETRFAAAEPDPPWPQAERAALLDFIEDRVRDIVGRGALLDRLAAIALGAPGNGRGAYVAGAPGAGKSALFGALHRRLAATDAVVLAHAAAASVAAASVDAMLQRWIGELAAVLGVEVALADDADARAVDAAFASLLRRAAARRPVVMLIDALDQLEPTPRARHLAWMPPDWPAGARLIVTGIAGPGTPEVAEQARLRLLPLPPLERADAIGIIAAICRRYRRALEPAVIEALLAKADARGPAWASPLWLVLAVEALNLLDADDFARAERNDTVSVGERLRALMLDIVAQFPPDIDGLYGFTFERAAKAYGAKATHAFLAVLALGRAGWREDDFTALIRRITGEDCLPLALAHLRRGFRGQLRKRGAIDRWDCNHAQMRAAARRRLAAWGLPDAPRLHAVIVDHLLGRGADDPLRVAETMFHLLASQDARRGAEHLGGDLTADEVRGAASVLADAAVRPASEEAPGLPAVLAMLAADDCDLAYQEYAAQRLMFLVYDAIGSRAPLDIAEELARALCYFFDRIVALARSIMATEPRDGDAEDFARFAGQQAAAWSRLAAVQRHRGVLADAEASLRRSLAVTAELVEAQPDNAGWQRDLSVAHNQLGRLLMSRDHVAEALEHFRTALRMIGQAAVERLDDEVMQRDIAITRMACADAEARLGDAAAAGSSLRTALAIFGRLASRDPSDVARRSDLAAAQDRLAAMAFDAGRLDEAEAQIRAVAALRDWIARRDPEDRGNLHAVFTSHLQLAMVCRKMAGRAGDAEQAARAAVQAARRLGALDPSNASWARDLAQAERVLAGLQAGGGASGEGGEGVER